MNLTGPPVALPVACPQPRATPQQEGERIAVAGLGQIERRYVLHGAQKRLAAAGSALNDVVALQDEHGGRPYQRPVDLIRAMARAAGPLPEVQIAVYRAALHQIAHHSAACLAAGPNHLAALAL